MSDINNGDWTTELGLKVGNYKCIKNTDSKTFLYTCSIPFIILKI